MDIDDAASVAEAPVVSDDAQTDITDPDDIDALLESMDIDDAASVAESPVVPDDAQTEITDPDDIDALLESMNIDDAAPEKAPLVEEDDAQTEITDPDDIDALLESMNIDDVAPEKAPLVEGDDAQTEITDPDDIDALLESMNIDDATPEKAPLVEEEDAQTEITDPDDIDALLESMDIDVPDNSTPTEGEVVDAPQGKVENDDSQAVTSEADTSESRAKFESLKEEYVAPLLSIDFSDILATTADELSEDESTQTNDSPEIDEDFDIDELIADVGQSMESSVENEQSSADEILDIGDDLVTETFDENTLEELLNDEESEYAIELSPDFSDKNVLADLLNDNDENTDNKVSEASEINDIQELDNLDFDELLANIEEESSVANQPVDFTQNDGVDDEITLSDFDNFSSDTSDNNEEKVEDNFVSVDSLLSDSQYDVSSGEPYEKANIDVGLNEFPEFTGDVNQIDVDIDENGIAAKLDLAKVYLEIGDEDNALVILKEVLKLGDTEQQAQAQSLLDNLE